ncbi:MAG TPA: hypothetical protein VFN10_20040 [Thermoanaerobaculia bacterium]|nr:hypothetical protein [Thermoanaerobaculia bacterium]
MTARLLALALLLLTACSRGEAPPEATETQTTGTSQTAPASPAESTTAPSDTGTTAGTSPTGSSVDPTMTSGTAVPPATTTT